MSLRLLKYAFIEDYAEPRWFNTPATLVDSYDVIIIGAGGHGLAFDWSILKGWEAPKPWILAGGLTPENVKDAVAATGAPAVDVSSGVERLRGLKDRELVRAFLRAAKEVSK